jgi:hypothetical protein
MAVQVETVPQLDEGWIRAVLFEHRLDDWVDLAVDPITRRHVGQLYAEQVGAAYQSWKWLCEQRGADVAEPPPDGELPPALELALAARDWTDLVVTLMLVVRAQGMLFGDLARSGDETQQRNFQRLQLDCAGEAALGLAMLYRRYVIQQEPAQARLDELAGAVERWLAATTLTHVAAAWRGEVATLLLSAGYRSPI